jgi:hypothetical protein
MKLISLKAAALAVAGLALTSCTVSATGYGTTTNGGGISRAGIKLTTSHPASITFVLKCSDVPVEFIGGPFPIPFGAGLKGSGHFVFRDPAARVAVTGTDIVGCFAEGPYTDYVGHYRSATGRGWYDLSFGPSGSGPGPCIPICISGPRTVGITGTSNVFQLHLSGSGPEDGYSILSGLNGKLTLNF